MGDVTQPPGGQGADLRRSPLDARHRALGAKFSAFAGWQMPREYAGGGVVAEHRAVRGAVGVFDVSHLGAVRVTGADAAGFVNRCLSNDLGRIRPGQAQYTLCCDERTGGVVDDIIAYLHGADHVFLVPNAANTAEVVRRLRAAAPAGVAVVDEHGAHAVLAVQGPASRAVLDALRLPAGHDYMSFAPARHGGAELVVCRTGYTGEHGYELITPAGAAPALWDALFAAGAEHGIRACGLGARDTLRTEMGYPLHGQDLRPDITPVQARCGWAVGWSKPVFWGRAALLAEKAAGPARLLWGIEATGRGIPRPHQRVLVGERTVGEVTSGTFSPTRKVGIGLALLDGGLAEGDAVDVDVRGRQEPMRVVRPPFVPASVR
jgi:aminomethyltransferase